MYVNQFVEISFFVLIGSHPNGMGAVRLIEAYAKLMRDRRMRLSSEYE